MSSPEQTLRVIGHRNPDTDSICSAIAYARYKQDVAGIPAVPCRAGNLNPQTRFVLDRFGVAEPQLLTSLHPRIEDIMIKGADLITLTENDTLGTARDILVDRKFAFLPVTGVDGRYVGRVTALRLAALTRDLAATCRRPDASIRLADFIDSIDGTILSGTASETFEGTIWFRGIGADPGPSETPLLVVDLDGQAGGLADACDHGAAVIVVCSDSPGNPAGITVPSGCKACVISTSRDVFEIAVSLCLAAPLRESIEREEPVFGPLDLVRDVRREVRKSNEGGFCVVDDDGFVRGVITRQSFLTQWRFRVALVDHNEPSQCVEGIEDAAIEEIIDHHRLGFHSTDQPITFINKVVGCTSTIIAELYRNARSEPPREIAGLMLAAVLSDTVILQSPTTTALDHEMAGWLADLAGVDLQSFGTAMFAAGCDLEGRDPKGLIHQDLKVYEESGWKLSVSQIETVGFEAVRTMGDALAAELDRAREEAGCHFACLMITDITSSTSLLLCAGDHAIIDAIQYPKAGRNLFEMSGVLSRKKQMMPYLADLLRRVGAAPAN